jgi:hypothetical protein
VPASDLFVMALVVMCIAVVALVAVHSRHGAKVKAKDTLPIDQEDQISAAADRARMTLPGPWP